MNRLFALLLALLPMFLNAQDAPPRKTIDLPNGRAAEIPAGPFEPSWESIRENYRTPQWFVDGKFGIFIHWGVYSVPAAGSEWYPRHMYGAMLDEHTKESIFPKASPPSTPTTKSPASASPNAAATSTSSS